MAKFINPFTDIGFKKIFGQEITKDLLIDFLNDLLVGEREIKDIKFLDKEQLGTSMLDRSMIYDVYCETSTGEKIIVEMQNKAQANFKERSIYYLSNAIVGQGERGAKWEYGIKAVYGVFFMNFHLEENAQRVRRDVILADKETQEQFSDKMRFIYLEFPSFQLPEDIVEGAAGGIQELFSRIRNTIQNKQLYFQVQQPIGQYTKRNPKRAPRFHARAPLSYSSKKGDFASIARISSWEKCRPCPIPGHLSRASSQLSRERSRETRPSISEVPTWRRTRCQ